MAVFGFMQEIENEKPTIPSIYPEVRKVIAWVTFLNLKNYFIVYLRSKIPSSQLQIEDV